MSKVNDTIDVNAPIRRVYTLWTQFKYFPTFMHGVERIEQRSETDLYWKVKVGGVERDFDAVVTEQVPDERVAWRSIDGETHAGVVFFHQLSPDRTRVTVELDWKPQGFVEHAGAALQVDDIQIGLDLHRFKEIAERPAVDDGWGGAGDGDPDPSEE